jgi:hypothetical protein
MKFIVKSGLRVCVAWWVAVMWLMPCPTVHAASNQATPTYEYHGQSASINTIVCGSTSSVKLYTPTDSTSQVPRTRQVSFYNPTNWKLYLATFSFLVTDVSSTSAHYVVDVASSGINSRLTLQSDCTYYVMFDPNQANVSSTSIRVLIEQQR